MLCPRCGSEKTRRMVSSPVGNEWEVFVCDKCCFSWRSTEEIHVLPSFRLDDEKIANMATVPPIPPLK